jgi:hypothetical protein
MVASVSPASYLLIISGQSRWGIFPLLLDLSILLTFAFRFCLYLLDSQARISSIAASLRQRWSTRMRMSTARAVISAGPLAEAEVSTVTRAFTDTSQYRAIRQQ